MITPPIHIGPKGQIVLPKAIRTALGSQNVVFEITETQITLRPVPNMSGALSQYKKNYQNFDDVRTQAWEESSRDR